MKRDTIKEQFLSVVLTCQGIDLSGKLADRIISHMDSMELIQTVVDCERHFNLKINDEAVESLVTFDDLINLIHDAKAIAI